MQAVKEPLVELVRQEIRAVFGPMIRQMSRTRVDSSDVRLILPTSGATTCSSTAAGVKPARSTFSYACAKRP